MKTLSGFIQESLKTWGTVSGMKYVRCVNKEFDIKYNLKSNKWHRNLFTYLGDDYVGYYCPDATVIFYHRVGGNRWAAVLPFDRVSDDMFSDFESTADNNSTVPEFDKFDTNLE